jgi:branched-chain amino acid transport system substrate-binding protein
LTKASVPLSTRAKKALALFATAGVMLVGANVSLAAAPDNAATKKTAAAGANHQPIKIGFLTPLTGVAAGSGPDLLNGFKLFLEENHNQLAGRPIQLIVENDESSAATAVGKIHKLVEDDKVDILAGMILSNMAYAAAPKVEAYQVPLVLPLSAADDLTKRKHYKWVIRTGWSASQPAHPFGEYVYNKLHYKKVAILGVDFAMSWEQVGGFQRSFEESGGKVVQKVWAPLGFKDFKEPISHLSKDADAIFVMSAVDSADIIAKQIKQYGPKLPIIGGGPSYDETIFSTVGDDALGAITPFHYSAVLDRPEMKRFNASYRKMFKSEPGQFAESAYVSGMVIKAALEAVHGNVGDKEKFLSALKHADIPDAPRGPIKMDEYGNPTENVYVRQVKKVNGHLENVVIDTFPHVSQFWKYDPAEFLKQPAYSKDYPPCKYCADK